MEIIHSFVNSFLISEHFFGHFLRTFTLKYFFWCRSYCKNNELQLCEPSCLSPELTTRTGR